MYLHIRDTLSGRLTAVRRRPGRPLGMYVCGPTVYAPAHVGHARTYLYFDVVRRCLEAEGTPVAHVMNITDFEEKIDRRAASLGITWRALARREEAAFFRDLDVLGILRPTYRPRASSFIPRMVKVAARLERIGRIRQEDGVWYYCPPDRPRGANFPMGEKLADHAVVEAGHPFPATGAGMGDFMVWQRQDPPSPSWDGPWGRGMPGWHLECFAMASEYLGIPVDLHGGGLDLIYPHHHAENEIALALTGHRFSDVFLHTAFVLQGGAKMSKSIGNLITIREALTEAGPGGLRWYLLAPRYSVRLEWSSKEFRLAAEEFNHVRSTICRWLSGGGDGRIGATAARRLAAGVRDALLHDLATDRAMALVSDFAARIDRDPTGAIPRGERHAATVALRAIERRLGVPIS
jgi:cysteinyl-tRNA synthetase